jgi:hypothetical protein
MLRGVEYVNASEVMDRYHMSDVAFWKWLDSPEAPPHVRGSALTIKLSDLLKWEQTNKPKAFTKAEQRRASSTRAKALRPAGPTAS